MGVITWAWSVCVLMLNGLEARQSGQGQGSVILNPQSCLSRLDQMHTQMAECMSSALCSKTWLGVSKLQMLQVKDILDAEILKNEYNFRYQWPVAPWEITSPKNQGGFDVGAASCWVTECKTQKRNQSPLSALKVSPASGYTHPGRLVSVCVRFYPVRVCVLSHPAFHTHGTRSSVLVNSLAGLHTVCRHCSVALPSVANSGTGGLGTELTQTPHAQHGQHSAWSMYSVHCLSNVHSHQRAQSCIALVPRGPKIPNHLTLGVVDYRKTGGVLVVFGKWGWEARWWREKWHKKKKWIQIYKAGVQMFETINGNALILQSMLIYYKLHDQQ